MEKGGGTATGLEPTRRKLIEAEGLSRDPDLLNCSNLRVLRRTTIRPASALPQSALAESSGNRILAVKRFTNHYGMTRALTDSDSSPHDWKAGAVSSIRGFTLMIYERTVRFCSIEIPTPEQRRIAAVHSTFQWVQA